MEASARISKNTHHGHAIKRIRHTMGIKQDTLAEIMGTTQAKISNYEQKKVIEDVMIEKFAKALNIAPEFIKELEEDPVTVIIENNTFTCNEGGIGNLIGDNISYKNSDPIDKFIELSNEKIALYERMLELEKEKNFLLEKLLEERKG